MFKRLLPLVIFLIFPVVTLAANEVGLGSVANNLMTPVTVLSDFVHSASLIIGGMFIFASIIKYREHRRAPTMVPLSTVIFLLIAGSILVCLPLISMYSSGGIPYKIIR